MSDERTNSSVPAGEGTGSPRHLLGGHVRFVLVMLALLALSRLGLVAWKFGRVGDLGTALTVVLAGLRMDLIILSFLAIPAVLVGLIAGGGGGRRGRWVARGTQAYYTLFATLILFMEIATPSFILEFDSRPNRLFVEYLDRPREMGAMLLSGYKLELALGGALTLVGLFVARRLVVGSSLWPIRPIGPGGRLAAAAVALPLLFLGGRSSLQHRPANPSSVAFSNDHLINDLCLSSIYSVAYAVYRLKDEAEASAVYGSLGGDQAVIDEVRAAMTTVAPAEFVSDELPTLHVQTASARPARPLNLVILLEESLGASSVGALGGEPVTQFIDTLRDEGWWFEKMYATGTRSARGIEAVISGFLPTPGRSVVKLGRSQAGFFTLAEFLKRRGYHTQFIYGGESHFDNMKRFMTGNGILEVIDEDDYEDPRFHGSWGVSDEDIFQKAHESFLAAGDTPFFSFVFSVSNHTPWEYPPGRVEPYDSPRATRRNSERYADFALSKFFEAARQAPYWENTVFVVVSDHCSRVFGASLVPIEHFHIPAVILGPSIEPRIDERVASQIDLGPTLLSLIGVSGAHPMVGTDLTRLPDSAPGRAVMQYDQNHAYLEDGRVVIHQPERPPTQYAWDGVELSPMPLDDGLMRRARAHALMPSLLYSRRLYRLPDEDAAAARAH